MLTNNFLFHRPVAPKSVEELKGPIQETLRDADFIQITPEDMLLLSLLHSGMLDGHTTPDRFIPYYDAYDSCRRDFATRDTSSWEEAEVAKLGVRAIKRALIITTDGPDWLRRERNAVRRTSGIPSSRLLFKDSKYNPHVTIGKFIGTVEDTGGLYECEGTLNSLLEDIKTIRLGPLRLECGEHSWQFQRKQRLEPPIGAYMLSAALSNK